MDEREAGTVSSSVLTQVSILTEEEPHGRPSYTPSCDLESILESSPGWITTTKSDHEDGHSQAAASSASPSPDSVPHDRHTKFQDVQATIALPHERTQRNWKQYRRPVLLTLGISVIWILMLLPAIIYHVPVESSESDSIAPPPNGSVAPPNGSVAPLNISAYVPVCNKDFYLYSVSFNSTSLAYCLPLCGEWEEFSPTTADIMDGIQVAAAYINILGTTIVLVLSVILRKRMFTFPSIFVIYVVISLVVLFLNLSISFNNQKSLFCGSPDLLYSLEHPTTYCTFTGMILYYVSGQVHLLWLFHIISIFWSIQFPFHRRKVDNAGYTKYVHLAMVLVALLVPAVFAGVPFATGGYGISRFPPNLCHAVDPDTIYYVFMLPSTVIMPIGVTLMVITLQAVVAHMRGDNRLGRKRISVKMPSFAIFKSGDGQQGSTVKISRSEIRIIAVFFYFMVYSLLLQITILVRTRSLERFQTEVGDYFMCEAIGELPGKDCNRPFGRLGPEIVGATAYLMAAFYPFIYLIHVVNIDDLKEKLGWIQRCAKSSSTKNSSV